MDTCKSDDCNTLTKAKFDHYHIMVFIRLDDFKSQFKFLKIWSLHEDCERLIKEVWNEKSYGLPMSILASKIRSLKARLKVWNKLTFGNVHNVVTLLKGI